MNKMELYMGDINKSYYGIVELSDNTITMKKGSRISPTISSAKKFKYSKEAMNYRNNKDIVKNNTLMKDVPFSSLSAAAQFVCGYSVSGNIAWNNKDGKKYKDIIK